MANHARQQIREAMGTALANLTTTGAHVYQTRLTPLENINLPALLINTLTESSERFTQGTPAKQQRTLDILVRAVAKKTADLDDQLDTICKEVEVALMADRTLGGKAQGSIELINTDIQFDGGHEQDVGIAAMTWRAIYEVFENAPDVLT